jgi:hypothetical protein
MRHWTILLVVLSGFAARAEMIDRSAIVVGRQVVKLSDVERDIRVTSFLNGQQPDFSPASRKQAASRLIDQALIREQVRSGEFRVASIAEADQLLAETRKDRFANDAQFKHSLSQYGIDEMDLRGRLLWQLTVLRFIDARFRPAVVVSDQEIREYCDKHAAASCTQKPQITQVIEGERINQLLNEWLDQGRKETRVEYLEKSLQ